MYFQLFYENMFEYLYKKIEISKWLIIYNEYINSQLTHMTKVHINKDYYTDGYKCTPAGHKKSMKYAVSNNIIKNGTLAKFTFKKTGAKGGYVVQKLSFNKLLKIYLNKKGLRIKNQNCNYDKKKADFETMSFKIVSK